MFLAEMYFHQLIQGPVWNTSLGRCPEGILLRCPNQHNTPFDAEEQRFYSKTLTNDRTSHLISKGESSHTTEESHLAACFLDLVLSVMNHPS